MAKTLPSLAHRANSNIYFRSDVKGDAEKLLDGTFLPILLRELYLKSVMARTRREKE